MAAKIDLVLDCADPERLAEFRSAALGYTTMGGAGSYVMIVDESGGQPKLMLQRVDEAKEGKNRMHLDIETPHVDDEVARLEGLGASARESRTEFGIRWVVMNDPEGNEFCVCDGGQSGG